MIAPRRTGFLPLFLAAAFALLPGSAGAGDRYLFDQNHGTVGFSVSSFGIPAVTGEIDKYEGEFVFSERRPDRDRVAVTLYSSAIHAAGGALDRELQGPHFFDAARFPRIRFVGTTVRFIDENDAEVRGTLTLLAASRPVVLHVHFLAGGEDDRNASGGRAVVRFAAWALIDRTRFGMDYLSPIIGDEVRIRIAATGTRADRIKATGPGR